MGGPERRGAENVGRRWIIRKQIQIFTTKVSNCKTQNLGSSLQRKLIKKMNSLVGEQDIGLLEKLNWEVFYLLCCFVPFISKASLSGYYKNSIDVIGKGFMEEMGY